MSVTKEEEKKENEERSRGGTQRKVTEWFGQGMERGRGEDSERKTYIGGRKGGLQQRGRSQKPEVGVRPQQGVVKRRAQRGKRGMVSGRKEQVGGNVGLDEAQEGSQNGK